MIYLVFQQTAAIVVLAVEIHLHFKNFAICFASSGNIYSKFNISSPVKYYLLILFYYLCKFSKLRGFNPRGVWVLNSLRANVKPYNNKISLFRFFVPLKQVINCNFLIFIYIMRHPELKVVYLFTFCFVYSRLLPCLGGEENCLQMSWKCIGFCPLRDLIPQYLQKIICLHQLKPLRLLNLSLTLK